jgi:glycosyltransferase involved in cell wall biosynthesis
MHTAFVVHTIGSIGESVGGPARTVPSLCRAAMAADDLLHCEIVTTRDGPLGPSLKTPGVLTYDVAFADRSRAYPLLLDRILTKRTARDGMGTIIHDHGQWFLSNRAAAITARRHGTPRIVSPRGMQSPWARQHRRWKKDLAWWAFAHRDLMTADLLHATSDLEAAELRSLGARQPIAIIPNGVELRPPGDTASAGKTNTLVFLSRLHVKKGVNELVAAWRAVQPRGWRLILAGPDEGGLVSGLRITATDAIDYVGSVSGEAKWRLLESAGVVVLPSHSENFGVVVAEALMAGTPVIATHGTPWSGLRDHTCGWWIPLTAADLADTIRSATELPPATLADMGRNGRAWVTTAFSWPPIGRQMADVYRWMLGGGSAPACVVL